MLEPEVAAKTSAYIRYATPNEKAFKLLSSDIIHDPNLYPPPKVLDKCEQIGEVGQALFVYDRCWTELKCS
jgi:spermidine/putrescine transport system substrate-binding protein